MDIMEHGKNFENEARLGNFYLPASEPDLDTYLNTADGKQARGFKKGKQQTIKSGLASPQKRNMKKKKSKVPLARAIDVLMGTKVCGETPTFSAGIAPVCRDVENNETSKQSPKSLESLLAETCVVVKKKRTRRLNFTTCTSTGIAPVCGDVENNETSKHSPKNIESLLAEKYVIVKKKRTRRLNFTICTSTEIASVLGDVENNEISKNSAKSIESMLRETHVITKKKRTRRLYFTTCTTTGILKKKPSTVEEITDLLKCLDINTERNRARREQRREFAPFSFQFGDRSARIPYQEGGIVVPFVRSFDPLKNGSPRPKVKIDEETEGFWRLLLENINNDGIGGSDDEKTKWWDEERRLFQGRANEFISRMHLVQGDRCFSEWKGSVLDSVIGAFLTQNTSDHQSSSAFMSLAARFPLDSNSSTLTGKTMKEIKKKVDWDSFLFQALGKGKRIANTTDSLDWEAVRNSDVDEVAETIKNRGMNKKLAKRIQAFLNRLVEEHGSTELEWLRDISPDKAKEYLMSVEGFGLKSTECVRLLTLHQLAFPVDTNVGRVAVRLGWVPLQEMPESLQLHLLKLYPVVNSIQRYLWPRLCKLDQKTLYELHYQMITFGKVFCTKSKPNCNSCPMRGECRHFASAFASARLGLPNLEEKSIKTATDKKQAYQSPVESFQQLHLPSPQCNQQTQAQSQLQCVPIISLLSTSEPIVEVPTTPDLEEMSELTDIQDALCEDPDEIPLIKLINEDLTLQKCMHQNTELQEVHVSKALVALSPKNASIPMPMLKNVNKLRTEHSVYELPDFHPLLVDLHVDNREPDDPCPYLLAIWTPGETENSIKPPERRCNTQESGELCSDTTCFSCQSIQEANSQTVRGTLLIPCRTAMRGSFPLNGTYFQVNEVFSDHHSSLYPIDVRRSLIWNLPRRIVYFGTSITAVFRGLSTERIQDCFWRGFVCLRGFDRKNCAPRPLTVRMHFPTTASKLRQEPRETD